MSWVFIVVRYNIVETVKTFDDYWVGSEYVDKFIMDIDKSANLPAYNKNEYYRVGDLTIGLYKSL